jgi:DNA-binding protein H-NS
MKTYATTTLQKREISARTSATQAMFKIWAVALLQQTPRRLKVAVLSFRQAHNKRERSTMTAPATLEATKVNLDLLVLHEYTTTELQTAFKRFGAELERRKGAEKIKAKLTKMAKEAGLKITIEGSDGAFAGEPVKYKNPDNEFETWTGRGRKPTWLVVAMKSGKKLEDFEVKPETKQESPKHEPPLPLKSDPNKEPHKEFHAKL